MKILFITHCHGHYGASKSLQLLIRNYQDHDVSLIVPKGLRKANDLREIREFYGDHIQDISEYHLPFKYCYMGCPTEKSLIFKNFILNLIYGLNKGHLLNKLRSENYDIIHLNAPVLYPLISEDLPFTVHIRDLLLENQTHAFQQLQRAKGLIFIDEGTRKPFENIPLKHSIVLNNPFDMTYLEDRYDEDEILKGYEIPKGKIIFNCIGRIKDSKGVKFIIESFLKTEDPNYCLLICGVGDPGSKYESICRDLAGPDERVRFLGEEKEIGKVYKVSDYVIRGDPSHLIGRTVFEGLFADCNVIMPGTLDDLEQNPDISGYISKISVYAPRDHSSLTEKLNQCNKKIPKSNYHSNVGNYIKKFDDFMKQITNSGQ